MSSLFGYLPSESRCGNVPNELVHRAGPPFLDNHYHGTILAMCGSYAFSSVVTCVEEFCIRWLVSLLFDDLSSHSYPFTFLTLLNFFFLA